VPTSTRPKMVLASPMSPKTDRGIPHHTHLTAAEDYTLRRGFETGLIPGTMGEFIQEATHDRLLAVGDGTLAADDKYQLALFYMRREKEDREFCNHTTQLSESMHSALSHIGEYGRMRDKGAIAEYLSWRWNEVEGLPPSFWKEQQTKLFNESIFCKVAAGLHKHGFTLSPGLVSYLGL
jgi:hypothetical protein